MVPLVQLKEQLDSLSVADRAELALSLSNSGWIVFFERRKCSTSKVCSLIPQESLEHLILTIQCHVMVCPECERLQRFGLYSL